MRNLHPSLAESIWRTSPVFSLINGCGESEWALCLTLSSKQQYLSQGVLPLPNHPYWLWLRTDLPSLLACSRQTQNYPLLACSLAHFLPFFPFPISVLQWNEATDRQMGRWGSTVFPGPKANWERLGKDLRRWMVLTWWENQCTLPVYLHHAEVRDHSLMLSLLGVIRSFVSTLTPRSEDPAQDWLNRAWLVLWESERWCTHRVHAFLKTAKCLHWRHLQ